ncbi:MAG TPA: zinc-binding alcohol dehydrogenase family protein [Candidatus Sulfotelmatobacter sp.]|nr:zinc-binding alcohol dehydrogenase family protein [Candidatus Sulfotelmatobacter sp.]
MNAPAAGRRLELAAPGALGRGRLHLVEAPVPKAGPGELLLRVAACAVCRTDLQLVSGDLPAHRLPIVPGHQVVGTVVAQGAGVTGWAAGERVGVPWVADVDGTCPACRSGRENLCPAARFTGWDRDGGFADYVTAAADHVYQLPAAFSDLEAAPLLCGGIIGYRALKVCGIEPGGRLGLFGFGASARLALQVARHWGCEVAVFTRSEAERSRAQALGAAWVGGYADTPPAPLDGAVTFAPAGRVVVAALATLARGATLAINAIHLDRVPAFDYDQLWWERGIRSVANFTRHDGREFLDLAQRIPIVTDAQAFPLAEGLDALRRLRDGSLDGTAVLVP